jgi:hypothetical protein
VGSRGIRRSSQQTCSRCTRAISYASRDRSRPRRWLRSMTASGSRSVSREPTSTDNAFRIRMSMRKAFWTTRFAAGWRERPGAAPCRKPERLLDACCEFTATCSPFNDLPAARQNTSLNPHPEFGDRPDHFRHEKRSCQTRDHSAPGGDPLPRLHSGIIRSGRTWGACAVALSQFLCMSFGSRNAKGTMCTAGFASDPRRGLIYVAGALTFKVASSAWAPEPIRLLRNAAGFRRVSGSKRLSAQTGGEASSGKAL